MIETMSGVVGLSNLADILLFHKVSNSGHLLHQMNDLFKDGSELRSVGYKYYALIDLSLVCSFFHIQCAVMKAIVNYRQSSMVARSLSAEILYQMASTTKINEAFKQYGVNEGTSDLAVILIKGEHLVAAPAAAGVDLASPTEELSEEKATKRMKIEAAVDNTADAAAAAQARCCIGEIVSGEPLSEDVLADAAIFVTKEKADHIRRVFKLTPQEAAACSLESSVVTRIAIKDLL